MPVTSPDALLRALKGGKRGGVYFLFGEEEHLKEETAAAIIEAHLDPATRDFNYDQLRGAEVSPETLASVAATPPMMAEWRVVVVREAHALAAGARTRAVLEDLLKRPMPGLALILVATLPDKAKAQIYDRLKREAVSAEFPLLAAADLPGWLIERARTDNYEMDLDAARALAGAIGSDLGILMQELRKLYGYVNERRRITLADVHAAVGGLSYQDRWQWFDMLGEQRFAEARVALPILLDSGESGVGLVIGIGTHFLRLAILANGGQRALENALPQYQRWLAGRLVRQAKKWRSPDLDNALDDILRADRLLKSTNLGDHAVLEELILAFHARAHQN